ncbi:MAG: PhoH family protein [Bacteroidales bacterium]|nr:PhoH family protein [Candidatus Egerieousia equi]
MTKIFILDTNVILHDYRSIYNFQENNLVIPIAVLEEVDKFKKGNGTVNYNAREFVRLIDRISDPRLYGMDKGFPLGNGLGKLAIEVNHPFPPELKDCFMDDFQDHRILSTALWVKSQNPDKVVGLVSKDVNLRLKARALGMLSQDYLSDHIKEEKIVQNEARIITVKGLGKDVLARIEKAGVKSAEIERNLPSSVDIAANQLFRMFRPLKDGARQPDLLARYNKKYDLIQPIQYRNVCEIKPRNVEQKFALDLLNDNNISLVSLTGVSGSGKSLLALASAISQLDRYDQVLVACKTESTAGSELEHVALNIDFDQMYKLFSLPMEDNLKVIRKHIGDDSALSAKLDSYMKNDLINMVPLSLLRGRSLSKVFLIVENAQNLTPYEVKAIITRAGEGTKMVFTGNMQQIEHPYLDRWSNGLVHITDKLFGEQIFAHVNLSRGERSELSDLAGAKLG